MKKLLFLFFILQGTWAYSQQTKTAEPKDKIELGSFDNYAFIMDGKLIERSKLAEYPEAELYDIYPWRETLEGKEYLGIVYFHTQPQSSSLFADDPAWFLNGRQVSSFNIRETYPEFYTRIIKSTADTIISNKLYKGSIHITTEEDYFGIRKNLTQVLLNYNEIDSNQTMLFWFRSVPQIAKIPDIGMIVHDNFSINYLNKNGESRMKMDTLQFAKGKKTIVQIINAGNRLGKATLWGSSNKTLTIFKKPLLVDTEYPCYLQDFDGDSIDVFQDQSIEIKPIPFDGREDYLVKLAATLKLPAKKSSVPLITDSINVNFLVTNLGLLTGLESDSDHTSANESILSAIKKNACVWTPGVQGGRFIYTARKMKIFYTKDQKGNIQSLDRLEFESI